ncbi:MAG: sigma factor-like helix-turn-helix DNA-binding protein [Euzebya sp.]
MSASAGTDRPGQDKSEQGKSGQGKSGQGKGGQRSGQNQGGGRPNGPRRDSRSSEEQEAVRLRSKLLSLLKRLPQVEREVLEARMGLVDGQPMKPGEVASRMGMTIPEVKKIEARAFDRIRQIGPLKGLERFLDH